MASPSIHSFFVNDSTLQSIEDEANYYRKSPNIIFLPCGLTFIKNTKGWASIGGIIFGWAYATYFAPAIILWPRYDEDHIGLAPIILFYILSTGTIVSLFRAATADPGWVPFDMSPANPAKLDWTHCTRCLVKRPLKSHHCGKCQRCVRNMDHHCHWINNCVAEDNQWLFILLVLYGALLSVYTLFLVALHFYYFPLCTLCNHLSFTHKYSKYLMYWQFAQGLALVAICTSQVVVQVGNILMNKTTIEEIINSSKPLHERQAAPVVTKSARDLFQKVCGDAPILCWLNPFRRRRLRPQIYYPQQHHV
ncbi:palmitoyltransferase ZDHHC21-like [Amphiura filiformis]|uniref:palmitoyltransferase ZDHHC21-like n=1 Tax=Amphiura filiformis TaxID=82378 RepID=UPI003B214221